MTERHEKWVRVEPGTVIPAGQPYRVEYIETAPEIATELVSGQHVVQDRYDGYRADQFVDSSWKPPQCGATHPSNNSVIPCQLQPLHEGDHFSTSGCAGGGFHWPRLGVLILDTKDLDRRARAADFKSGTWSDVFTPPEVLALIKDRDDWIARHGTIDELRIKAEAQVRRVEAVLAKHWDWKAGRSLHAAITAALGPPLTDEQVQRIEAAR